ncbi:hypothetical protein WA026_015144 [Henosepilachna vigintioctopunctata]|uniref:Uncharacterized protein n=1 Tax=Henosepilachna vigintioctopunctata TaxID=420089 RepID=A0AAW1TVP9_9CUCU
MAANSAYSLVPYVDDRKDINSLEMIENRNDRSNLVVREFAKTATYKITEKVFEKGMGKIINYAKDWDGGRKDRYNADGTKNKRKTPSPDDTSASSPAKH